MTKDEIFNKHSFSAIGAISPSKDFCLKAMDEYAKQQAIAFVKYNCPDIKFDDTLLDAGYAGFLIHQQQNKDNGNKGEG